MGNTGCGQLCHDVKQNKLQIMQVQITPRYDAIQWIKEQEQPTAPIPVPFRTSQKIIEHFNAEDDETSFNNPPKVIQWEDEAAPSIDEQSEVPVVETRIQQNHYLVPASLIRQRISDKLKFSIKSQYNSIPLSDNSKWYLLPSGNYFNGILKNGIPSGPGTYLLSNKIFIGQIKDGKPQGLGVLAAEQFYCKGPFQNGYVSGEAFLQIGQMKIKGYFKNGDISKGIIKTPLYQYQGQFNQGEPEGQGRYHDLQNKNSYQGLFFKGNFHGEGVFKCQEYIFRGRFQNGLKQGRGTVEYFNNNSNSRIKSGVWKQDYLLSENL